MQTPMSIGSPGPREGRRVGSPALLLLFSCLLLRGVCVSITAVPITKLFAWGGETMEDMCYERLRAEACVD
jgi:hypothetical protein